PGQSVVQSQLRLDNPRLWELSDPFLYRITARISRAGSGLFDEQSVHCGFRDFRFENGAFRLNGRRIYLRCSHTGNCCPIGLELPHDPDFLRRDLVNAKAMRFNAIRFIAGVAKRYQLDLCDEIGLMVYEEPYAAWCMSDSPKFAHRYDDSALGMVLRDRNHPSLAMWGLLNETPDGPVFRHALNFLSALRERDDSRMVMLNSGRWDNSNGRISGIEGWHPPGRDDPCVTLNVSDHVVKALGITWAPGQHDGFINLRGAGTESKYHGAIAVRKGDTIDCVCGFGNNDYGADTTALSIAVRSSAGHTWNAARDFSSRQNPNGVWSYGQCSAAPNPRADTFARFPAQPSVVAIGSLSNPGSTVWEDVLDDKHPYQGVPHTAGIIQTLRTLGDNGKPLFISEYGIGSAVDLLRVVRLYEQAGKPDVDDAQLYRQLRDRFLADWQRWKMSEAFDRPEDFFAQSNARMAAQRLLGLNAIRANPNVVGHSVTGTVDQGMTGEGLWTTFRELKPGTVDALFDSFAPLRWCLFAEPVNVYRRTPVRLEARLANEDALPPGQYPVRLQVVGPGTTHIWQQTLTVTIPETKDKSEPPMVLPVFDQPVVIDGPAGKYQFSATFQRGAAAAGEVVEFYVADPAPPLGIDAEVVVWGDDAGLDQWLREHGIRSRPFSPTAPLGRELIVATARPPAPGGAAVFAELARRVARGATVVFLCPAVFAQGNEKTAWLPLIRKGDLAELPSWLYHKDEWAKRHPIFAGLPAGGLMDYTFYRELIPQSAFTDLDPPAEAVAAGINASCGYSSGLLVAVFPLGAGEFVLNSLHIRENLGHHPAADRLLLNMLRLAAGKTHQPLAQLPADFDIHLKRLKYRD
ncbi:MAG: glycoside hydrolase family 2 TIM barrel-domain containing protein, partial [Thermoguttaceae bacterium]